MTQRVIPLTPPGPLWSQREYVAALQLGIEFSAHRADSYRQWFHYGFPGDIGCTSVLVSTEGPERYIDHPFIRELNWIDRCRQAVS